MRKGAQPNEYVWEKDNSIMVYVPGGVFPMGRDFAENEKPVHSVKLRAYYIDKFEVTRGNFKQFVEQTHYITTAEKLGNGFVVLPQAGSQMPGKSWRDPGFPQDDQHPVVLVSWDDAKAFTKWAGKSLPTEAQWEKAASWDEANQKKRIHPWGDADPAGRGCGCQTPVKRGNYADVSFAQLLPDGPFKQYLLEPTFGGQYDDNFVYTAPVGRFPLGVSAYGVFDLSGNVAEWCEDVYVANFYAHSPATDPVNEEGKDGRVIRGSGYEYPCTAPRSTTFRAFAPPDGRFSTLGFRTVVLAP
jgi:formylglycine-generating enzyme required for sulfatase activity